MVKVEIVQDQDEVNNSPYASNASSRTGSSASLSSVESELGDESLYDRLAALKDIVPPSTRHTISSKVSTTASFFKKGGKILGNIVWIVTTSALLVGLPLALSLEDEAKIVAQEKEMLAQQQGAQQVRTLNFEYAFPEPVLTLCADAWWLFAVSPAGFRTAAKGHRSSWFLVLYMYHPYTHAYTLLMSPPLRLLVFGVMLPSLNTTMVTWSVRTSRGPRFHEDFYATGTTRSTIQPVESVFTY